MEKRTCRHCGANIPSGAHKRRIYCSKSCGRKSTYRRKYPEWHLVGGGPCSHCAETIPTRPGSVEPDYCSPECRRDAARARAKANYERTKDQVNAESRARSAARRAAITKVCPQCGEPFTPERSLKQRYCSKRCLGAATRDSAGTECSETDCGRPVRAKGLCNMHYKRVLRAEGRMNDVNWNERRRAAWKARYALTRGAPDAEKFDYREIYERDGWVCGICSEPVDPDLAWPDPMSVSLDHVIPVSRGGRHVRENAQCAHLTCNVRKLDRVDVA